jgi:hypothetical protein
MNANSHEFQMSKENASRAQQDDLGEPPNADKRTDTDAATFLD